MLASYTFKIDKMGIMTVQRPITPEEVKKKCLNCVSMEDFIKNLQNEIKRLQVSYNHHA